MASLALLQAMFLSLLLEFHANRGDRDRCIDWNGITVTFTLYNRWLSQNISFL